MPGNILSADTGFPDLEGARSTEEKLRLISGYLYTLLEQLRYTLSNLGQDNFNEAELDGLSKTLTGPLLLKMKDVEGNLAKVVLAANELSTKVESVEGGVSEVRQTAETLSARVEGVEGGVSTIEQKVDGFTVTINSVTGRVTAVEATVNGLDISTTGSGKSSLSAKALNFYGNDIFGNSVFIGRVEAITDKASGGSGNNLVMLVGTENGYSLKLQSDESSSWESVKGNITIKSDEGRIDLWPNANSAESVYIFTDKGIFYGNKKIVDNTKAV